MPEVQEQGANRLGSGETSFQLADGAVSLWPHLAFLFFSVEEARKLWYLFLIL
jgi:hypothetical protein